MKTKQAWKLPIVFLIGYVSAWGSILLDRQMIIDEQRSLQEEVNRTRIEFNIATMIEEYNKDYVEMVEWTREAMEEPKELENQKTTQGEVND